MKTAEQWVEHIGQLQGSFAVSALELIRAIQQDALEAAARECDLGYSSTNWPEPIESIVSKRIRALIPPRY